MINRFVTNEQGVKVFDNLMAQSKNGSGKTGAFSIGSVLRIDPSVPKLQVLILCHIRELTLQIAEVYSKLCAHTNIKVTNLTTAKKYNDEHVATITMGKLKNILNSKKSPLDLSAVKCIIIDEADVFFSDDKNHDQVKEIVMEHFEHHKPQYILFSATYPEQTKQNITNLFGVL
jgi:superfamily II DNA/RNA helicase